MQIYVIGKDGGPFEIGVARDAAAVAAERDLPLLKSAELARGWDDLALAIATNELPLSSRRNGVAVYQVPAVTVKTAIEKAIRATTGQSLTPVHFGAAIKRIRTEVFRTTQECMGEIAGVTGSKVSRWESGEIVPSLDEIAQLRIYAERNGLRWDDALLFSDYLDPPKEDPTHDRDGGTPRQQERARKASEPRRAVRGERGRRKAPVQRRARKAQKEGA
jgi:DNA-binding transcriptional regulator YiaG